APASIALDPTALSASDAEALAEARILIIDDSQVALQQSLQTLRSLGITCHTARSAKEAIERLLELQGTHEQINVVVSDIEMPEMDGYAFTRSLRESSDFKDLYVLLHTSLDSVLNADKARVAGADDVLTKFSSPELTKCLVQAARVMQDRRA
ncbi:MAG: response regulator, partial [Sphingomonadaceae bacterium]